MNAIILAGGKSSRTSEYKAFLEVGGEKIINRIIVKLQEVFKETIIIADEESKYRGYGLKIFRDKVPHKGPLMGLYTGLLHAQSDYNFVVGCDQPFLDPDLIKYMVKKALNVDILMPKIKGQLQPLHAIYNKNCLPLIEKNMMEDKYSFYGLCQWARVDYINEEEINSICNIDKAFFNVNTDVDLLKAEEMV